MRDRQSSCLHTHSIKCWRSVKATGGRASRSSSFTSPFPLYKEVPSNINDCILRWSLKDVEVFILKTPYDCFLMIPTCVATLAEETLMKTDRLLMRRNTWEARVISFYQYLLKTSFALRTIKLETIFVKNEDANEDEDASWKIVYELRMITACLIWNHKGRGFLYARVYLRSSLRSNVSSHHWASKFSNDNVLLYENIPP